MMVIGLVCFAFIKPDTYQCNAMNGECRPGQDPDADQCCRYQCCMNARRLDGETAPNATAGSDSERSLLSKRRLTDGFGPSGCRVVDETEDMECACRQSGKNRVCDGTVRVDGLFSVVEGRQWPWVPAMGGVQLGWLVPTAWTIYAQCSLKGQIEPVLEPWRQKGLTYNYVRASKHTQARIQVWTPATAQVVGAYVA